MDSLGTCYRQIRYLLQTISKAPHAAIETQYVTRTRLRASCRPRCRIDREACNCIAPVVVFLPNGAILPIQIVFSATQSAHVPSNGSDDVTLLPPLPGSISFVCIFPGGSLVYLVESQFSSETWRLSLYPKLCSPMLHPARQYLFRYDLPRRCSSCCGDAFKVPGCEVGLSGCIAACLSREGIPTLFQVHLAQTRQTPGYHFNVARRCNRPIW